MAEGRSPLSGSQLREPGTQAGTSILSSVGTAAGGDLVIPPNRPQGRLITFCVIKPGILYMPSQHDEPDSVSAQPPFRSQIFSVLHVCLLREAV